MRKGTTAAIIAFLVLASLGVGYLSGNSARGAETITSTSISVSTSTTTSISTVTVPFVLGAAAMEVDSNGSTGVDLILALNATTLKVGQSLNASVSLFNAFPSTNSIRTSNDWDFQGIPVALWPPCYLNLPGEAVVLKGNYTAQDLQSAANVTFSYRCSQGVSVNLLTFQPSSSMANLTGVNIPASDGNFTLGPHHLSLSFATNGYWDLLNNSQELNEPIIGQQSPPTPPIAIPFTPGVYTVAVADEWGQTAVLHFIVEP
jgi:hypothetical protein